MAPSIKDLKKSNKIAYDETIRKNLIELHKFLGLGMTDVAVEAIGGSDTFLPHAKKALKSMSKQASDLTVALLEARGDSKLSKEEENDFRSIALVTSTLGNLQFKLNDLIKMAEMGQGRSADFLNRASNFADAIMAAQAEFRNARAGINALGGLSEDPSIAYIFKGN
ncbi:hypothetical protein GF357_02845 [Candidatus Dojkabacteria bacterium]|nr:hypothetical protein [Candidatus Dojkabacteria bacterium]